MLRLLSQMLGARALGVEMKVGLYPYLIDTLDAAKSGAEELACFVTNWKE